MFSRTTRIASKQLQPEAKRQDVFYVCHILGRIVSSVLVPHAVLVMWMCVSFPEPTWGLWRPTPVLQMRAEWKQPSLERLQRHACLSTKNNPKCVSTHWYRNRISIHILDCEIGLRDRLITCVCAGVRVWCVRACVFTCERSHGTRWRHRWWT